MNIENLKQKVQNEAFNLGLTLLESEHGLYIIGFMKEPYARVYSETLEGYKKALKDIRGV